MSSPSQTSDQVAELATACVDHVQRALGIALDYTQDTLPLLDHYVREAVREAGPGERGRALLSPLLATTGSYFGVLTLRLFAGARFHAPGDDYASYRIEFAPFFMHFNPLGIAHEVITEADAPGWGAHFAMLDEARPVVEQSLAGSMPLNDRDYYSFSVRYETLEQVVAVLSALEEQRKGPPRNFPPEVYATTTGTPPTAKG